MLAAPFNIPRWIAINAHLLQPPVNAYRVFNEDFMVMIVGGPNARTDYHVNGTAEWFYQYRGAMVLKVVDEGSFRDIVIPEGSMFYLPANTPHSPIRFSDTVGVVVELRRPPGSMDRLRWYCSTCPGCVIVHEAAFNCTNLGDQINQAIDDFRGDDAKRTCRRCGRMADWAPSVGATPDPNLQPDAYKRG